MACLSSTTLTKQLTNLKFEDFCNDVNSHLDSNGTDTVSALKVVKALAWYLYEKSIDAKHRSNVLNCALVAAHIIQKHDNSEKVTKDTVNSLNIIIDRLQKVDKDLLLIAKLAPVVLSVMKCSPVKLTSLSQTLYVTLWNFSIGIVSSVVTEEDLLALLTIRDVALHCQLYDITVKTFSFAKFLLKVSNSCKSVSMQPESELAKVTTIQNLLGILESTEFKKCDRSQYWELCNFALEFIFKHQLFKHLEELLKLDIISDYKHILLFLKEIFVDIKVNIVEERIKTLTIEGEQMALLGLKLLLDKSDIIEHLQSIKKSHSNLYDDMVDNCFLQICQNSESASSVNYSCKLLTIIEKLELDNGVTEERIPITRKILSCHETQIKWLENNCKEKLVDQLNNFTINTTNIGWSLTSSKTRKISLEFLRISCLWSEKLLELDPTFSHYVLFSRYRTLADIEQFEDEHWDCLIHTARAVIYLLTSQHEQASEKLTELARFWTRRRITWSNQNKDKLLTGCEVSANEATILDLMSDSNLGNVGKSCEARLLIWEVAALRQNYTEGADLHEVVIRCLERILELDKTEVNVAMVLIEQAWTFWYQSGTEQLETAVRCCDKAVKTLQKLDEKLYLGVAYFIRFLVEQRLLQITIQAEVEEEEKRVVLEGRKEKTGIAKEGIGGETGIDDDGRPNYTGLCLETEQQLAQFLINSALAFATVDPSQDLGVWFSVKDLLDIQLGVAINLDIFNRPSSKLLESMIRLSEKHNQTDYVIYGLIRQYRKNPTIYHQNISKLCDMSKSLGDRGNAITSLYQISLTVARNFIHLNRYEECEEILDTILSNQFTQTHSDKSMLIGAESYHLASVLRYQNRRPIKLAQHSTKTETHSHYTPVASLGPLELEMEAFKLIEACTRYFEDDRTLPCRQNPRIVWSGATITELALEIGHHLIKLHNHIGAARELRAYIKWALKLSQTNCLPLHSCDFLIELAKSNLNCDDEAQAFVQLNGVQGILASVLSEGQKDRVKLADDTESRKDNMPGHHHFRSASPALYRHQLVQTTFLDDKEDCICENCCNNLLLGVYFKFANTWARALMMSGENRAAKLAFQTISSDIVKKVKTKYSVGARCLDQDMDGQTLNFQSIYFENLLLEAESLAFSGDLDAAIKLSESIHLPGSKTKDEIIVDVRLCHLNPTLVFRIIELKSSLSLAIKKPEVDSLTNDMSKLFVNKLMSDYQGQCTPVADRPNKTWTKAPTKKFYPSLGVGDAEHLAKELEKLNMFEETEQENEDDKNILPLKSVKGSLASRRKLCNLEAMIDTPEDVDKGSGGQKPKITITSETPRKSRSDLPSVSVKKKIPASMRKVLSPSSSNQKGKLSTDKKSVKIYEDGENYDNADLKTPAKKLTLASEDCGKTPGTTKRGGRSTKKTTATADNSSTERSTRKSSRSSAKRL